MSATSKPRPMTETMATGRRRQARRFELLDHPMFFLAHIVARFDNNVAFDLNLHGFSQSDWRILSTLQYTGGSTLTELARITTLERSFVGRVVGALEKRGYVIRTFPANDRRTTLVSLTPAGVATFRDVLMPATTQQIGKALDGISTADRAALFRVLRHMMRNVYRVAREVAPILDDERA